LTTGETSPGFVLRRCHASNLGQDRVSTTPGVYRSNQSTTRSIAESQLIAQNIMLTIFVYKKNIQITVFPIHMSTDEQVMIIMQYQISPKDKSSDR